MYNKYGGDGSKKKVRIASEKGEGFPSKLDAKLSLPSEPEEEERGDDVVLV